MIYMYIHIVVFESSMLQPSFVEIGSPVLEKKIFKGFYHIWAWRPSWSCDLDYLYIHWFPLPIDFFHIEFLIGQAVLEEKIIEIVDGRTDGRRTDAGSWPSYKLTL